MLHNFLGVSCGEEDPPTPAPPAGEAEASAATASAATAGHGIVSGGSSDHGSERQGVNNSEVFHFHGRKNISGPEASSTFSGRKRSYSDSAYTGLVRDGMFPVAPDFTESSRMMKMIGKEVVRERPGKSHDDEMLFSMQLPPRPTSSLVLQSPVSSRPDSLVSGWERAMPINPGKMMHYHPRPGQTGTYVDKLSSSYSYRDTSAGAAFVSRAAADEGSRTGIKGSGILKISNPSSGAAEKHSTAVLPCSIISRFPQITESESSASRRDIASNSLQMTIFYAGQAHVFDDVHPNKADVIMTLAGSNGGSWSTTYSPKKPNVHPPTSEAKISNSEIDMRTNNSPLVIHGNWDGGPRQAARIPVTTGHPGLISGALLGGDSRTSGPAGERDMEGRRNVS